MEKLLQQALKKVSQAEVYCLEEENLPVEFNNRQVSHIAGKRVKGYCLRVIDNQGRMGMATSSKLDRQDLIERAIISAKYGDKTEIEFPNQEGSDVKGYDKKLAQMDADGLAKQGQEMLNIITDIDSDIKCDLGLTKTIERVTILNSSGLNVSFDKTNFGVYVVSRADDGFMEHMDYDIYSNHFRFDRKRLERFVRYHNLSKKQTQIKTGKMDIIFNSSAMWPLLYRVFAGVDGSKVNKGLSPLEDRLGEKVFDSKVNITDDPTYPWGLGTTPYDDEGSVARKTPVIKDGVLKNYLFDLDSAKEYGAQSTGNGFKKMLFNKGLDQQPLTYASNFVLHPGQSNLEKMIQSVDRGIIINRTMGGHTGNIPAGEFGLNIGSGFLIENGEIKCKVVDAMVSGNIYDLFKDVSMIGQQLHATRAVFYGFAYTPAILVPNLVVAGSED